jgi:hypothetical protein
VRYLCASCRKERTAIFLNKGRVRNYTNLGA